MGFYDTNQESKHTEIPRNEKVDLFANSDSSIASPTKYILNNHKLEERKRDLELRRRNKIDKKVATEEHLTEIKRKMKETEDWKTKKQYFIDTVREIVPFFVGLAMVTIG